MKPIFTISQDTDTSARRELTNRAVLTYLYDRSRDSRVNNAPGQDFIAYTYTESRIAFAVCDGVSQSFYGDLSARFLGEQLSTWLIDVTLPDDPFSPAAGDTFSGMVDQQLRAWIGQGAAIVEGQPINPELPGMVRDALERKRTNGSETMFVAGLVDLAAGTLAACWMGDMRLRLFDADGAPIEIPGAAWETRERWSSRIGPKNGIPRTAILPLENIARIIAHSDGIGSQTDGLQMMDLTALDALARHMADQPGSDDISLLDISLFPAYAASLGRTLPAPKPMLGDPFEPVIRWSAIEGAGWYRIECLSDGALKILETEATYRYLPADLVALAQAGTLRCRVRAMSNDCAPGDWSETLEIRLPEVAKSPLIMRKPGGPMAVPIAPPRAPADQPSAPERTLDRTADLSAAAKTGSRDGPLLLYLALLLALALSVGWYVMNMIR